MLRRWPETKTGNHRWTLWILSFALLFVVLPASSPAQAQDYPTEFEVNPLAKHHIVLATANTPIYLQEGMALDEGLDIDAVTSSLRSYLASHPYVSFVPFEQARTTLRRDPRTQDIQSDADEARGFGLQHFFNYSLEQSESSLRRALRDYDRSFGTLIARSAMSETYQHLAFTLMEIAAESSQPSLLTEAQSALREAYKLTPHMVFDEQRQPAERVEIFRAARAEFLADERLRSIEKDQAQALASALGADHVVYPRLIQDSTGLIWLELDIYDAGLKVIVRDRIQLSNREASVEALTQALLSDYTSCLRPMPLIESSNQSEAGRFYLDSGVEYFVFLESPTSAPYDNLGAAFSLAYLFTENMGLTGRVSLAFSGDDREGDLINRTNTFRGSIGLLVTGSFEWLRLYFISGIEVAKPTDFDVSHNINCKVFGADDVQCPQNAVRHFDINALGGLNVAAGINLGIDPIFLNFSTNFAFYAVPFDLGKDINFPIGFDVGVEVRF